VTPLARRLYPLAVLLVGIVAAVAIVSLAGRARREDRAHADRRVATLVAHAVASRTEALARAVRGPALAFDLAGLEPREVSGVLRLSYSQTEGVTAVTLLDRGGQAVVPAAFLSRAGPSGGAHPVQSLDDLERFAHQIPLERALGQGRAVRGPYSTLRGEAARVALAETLPVADGTRTWVLAAEVDAARLLEGLETAVGDGEVGLVAGALTVGALARVPEEARAAIREVARRGQLGAEPEALAGSGWHAAVVRAPEGLDAVVAVAWSEGGETARARQRELALGVIVVSIVGALAAALAVSLREGGGEVPAEGPSRAPGSEARVLGAVVKELANPIAAMSAAAKLLGEDPGRGRVAESVQRGALRVERVFRRIARLARAGEESTRNSVDLAAVAQRELEAMRGEIEQVGLQLTTEGLKAPVMVMAVADDVALLVQALLEGARAMAPPRSGLHVALHGAALTVRDQGSLPAHERRALLKLGEGARTETAAPALAWALAARIAADHHATLTMQDVEGGVQAVVQFARG
jgi:hypothetical protein